MRKWMITGVVLFFMGVIGALAVMNLNSLINRNRDYLLNQAQRALGRKVSVGEIEVTLWKGIGLRLKNFALSDDPHFHSGDFIRAGDLQVNVKLLPLLRKELQIKRLILHDPVIEIVRDKEGKFNFSGIGKREKEIDDKKEKAPAKNSRDSDEEKRALFPSIALVDISRGEVHYLDRKAEIDLRIKAVDFRVKELGFDKPFTVDLAAALFSEKQNVKLQGNIGPLLSGGDFGNMPLDGKIDVDPLDLNQLTSAVPGLNRALPRDLRLSGILKVKDVQVKGTIKRLALKGTAEGTDAVINFGKTFQKASGIPFVFSTEAQYIDPSVSFRQAKLTLHTLALAGRGELSLGDIPLVNLTLDSSRTSLAGWDKIIPFLNPYRLSGDFEVHSTLRGNVGKGAAPQIQGNLILSGVSAQPPQFPKAIKDLNARVDFAGNRADLKETTLNLGNSRIRLAAQIDRFLPLTFSYQLSTPEVKPADFQASLPDERKADVIKNLSSEGSLTAKEGKLTFQGKVTSSQGTLYRIGYKDLIATILSEDKTTSIRNLRVGALNGSLEAEGEYSSSSSVPRFSFTSKVHGLDLKELYRALDPNGPRDIQGRLNADLKVSGSGKEWKEIKPNLRGQGQAEVLQGALLNFNLAEGVASSLTGIPGLTSLINPQTRQKYSETFEAKDTVFKELTGLFDLGEGRMQVKSLRITAADYTVQGSGWVDFDRRIDFRSTLAFSQRLSADLAHASREVKYLFNDQNQFEIPFALTGTLPKVKPKPDSKVLRQLIQRGMVRRGADELRRRFPGSKESAPPEESPPADQKKRDKGTREELIRKGLEKLFGR